jgi:hypothetical protein
MTFSPEPHPFAPARPSRLTLFLILLWVAEGFTLVSTLWAMVIAVVQLVAPGVFSFGASQPWMADYQREATRAALPVVTLPLEAVHVAVSAALIWLAVDCFRGRASGRDRLRSGLLLATGFVSLQFLWSLFTTYRVYAVLMSYLDLMTAQVGAGARPPPPGVAEGFRMTMIMSLGMGLVFAVAVFAVKLTLYLYTRHYLGTPEVDDYVAPRA